MNPAIQIQSQTKSRQQSSIRTPKNDMDRWSKVKPTSQPNNWAKAVPLDSSIDGTPGQASPSRSDKRANRITSIKSFKIQGNNEGIADHSTQLLLEASQYNAC